MSYESFEKAQAICKSTPNLTTQKEILECIHPNLVRWVEQAINIGIGEEYRYGFACPQCPFDFIEMGSTTLDDAIKTFPEYIKPHLDNWGIK